MKHDTDLQIFLALNSQINKKTKFLSKNIILKKKEKKKKKKRSVFCMKAILVKITSRCNFGWVKLKALVDEGANTI